MADESIAGFPAGSIRLAIVDDSPFVRKAIERIVAGERAIRVVGAAASGEELLEQLADWAPDIVTLDLSMPGVGGLHTLDALAARKIPVIVFSSYLGLDPSLSIEAAYRGTVEFIDKNEYSLIDFGALRAVLIEKICSLSGGAPVCAPAPEEVEADEDGTRPDARYRVIVIGASTGGPPAIQTIIENLAFIEVPVVIVQHMPAGFTGAFARRLDSIAPLPVREAADGERLDGGAVHIARGGVHLRLARERSGVTLRLSQTPFDHPHRPSVDILFESAAAVYGARAIGVLLTGMGRDGAAGLATLAAAGAHTIAQDAGSSAVYGMPRAAIESGVVREVLRLGAIAPRLRALLAETAASFRAAVPT
jgi:two-component system chemotaxis response regulator CheB